MSWVFITSTKNAHLAKKCLEQKRLYDKERKISKYTEEQVMIPIRDEVAELLNCENITSKTKNLLSIEGRVEFLDKPCVRRHKMSPQEKLRFDLDNMLHKREMTLEGLLLEDVPVHWEKHKDLILLPEKSFRSDQWGQFGDEIWQVVARSLGATRLAKKSTISNDNFRTPKVNLLLGNSGWVTHVDNGIKYTFDISKCMFSSGNITEKIRIGKLNCKGQTVVDLYAGIGYFVLPYLVHAKAALVHACEWNKHAVEALQKNLELNGAAEKCIIHQGDNQKFPLQGIADHVNLGLIPSSEVGWPVACAALRRDQGGWLHIHGNVSSGVALDERGGKYGDGVEAASALEETSMLSTFMEKTSASDNLQTLDGRAATCNSRQEITCSLQEKKSLELEYGMKAFCEIKGTTMLPTLTKETVAWDNSQILNGRVANSRQEIIPSLQAKKSLDLENVSEEKNVADDFSKRLPKIENDDNSGQNTSVFKKEGKDSAGNSLTVNDIEKQSPTCNRKVKLEWLKWAEYVACSLVPLLKKSHGDEDWEVQVRHIEHVKSYAPHIDHVVLDVECRPMRMLYQG